jgi:hypothetical protein
MVLYVGIFESPGSDSKPNIITVPIFIGDIGIYLERSGPYQRQRRALSKRNGTVAFQ